MAAAHALRRQLITESKATCSDYFELNSPSIPFDADRMAQKLGKILEELRERFKHYPHKEEFKTATELLRTYKDIPRPFRLTAHTLATAHTRADILWDKKAIWLLLTNWANWTVRAIEVRVGMLAYCRSVHFSIDGKVLKNEGTDALTNESLLLLESVHFISFVRTVVRVFISN